MAKSKAKKGLSGKKLAIILIPILAVLFAVILAAQIIMNWQYNLMCQQFGYGEMIIDTQGDEDTAELEANYIEYDYSTAADAKEHAEALTKEVEGEGAVLLENDGLLPLKGTASDPTKVTLFGYKTTQLAMSGSNTASLADALKANNTFSVNEATLSLYTRGLSGEPEVDKYNSLENTYAQYNDAAIVTFGRQSGEGGDVSMDLGESAYHRHGLTLTQNELDLLEYVCDHFENVIVLINSDNTMELDFIKDRNASGGYKNPYDGQTYDFSNIRACLWVGGVGKRGCEAVGEILNGDINPSGRLADTYVRDLLSTPSSYNFGDNTYTNVPSSSERYNSNDDKFVDYEEGIYIGYRYYETAYAEAKAGNYDGFDYDKEVLYPFGYGLSYSDYTMEFEGEPAYDKDTNTYTFQVKVTNTGDLPGKKVVQIYVNAPYIEETGIEVSQVVLGGFAKTPVLQKGEPQTVSVEVNMDYVISYDYKTSKSYVQQGGTYNFYLSDNAHSWASIAEGDESHLYSVELDNIIYDGGSGRGHEEKRASDSVTAVNQFDETTNYYFVGDQKTATEFSRSDFKGTFPTKPENQQAPAKAIEQLKKFDYATAANEEDVEPITGDNIGLMLIDLRGLDFNDPAWDAFMAQLTTQTLEKIYADGSFGERGDDTTGIPETTDLDGPYGFFGHATGLNLENCVYYNSEVVIASTWNTEMAAAVGDAIAEEGANQNVKITGWYGCAMNTHRSAFCGRNQEYFSEDGLLAGKMGAAEMGAASEKGLTTFVKHFALNDQETNRGGVLTWANEQAIREIYFRPFELYIKEATREVRYYAKNGAGEWEMLTKTMSGATGLMTAYSRIGATWTGASDAFATVLRDEWSFTGNICTDGGGGADSYMNNAAGLYTGATTMILSATSLSTQHGFSTSATTINKLLEAVKYNLFNRVNSNIMQGVPPGSSISYTMAPWQIFLVGCWVGFGVLAAGAAVWIVLVSLRNKKKAAESAPQE